MIQLASHRLIGPAATALAVIRAKAERLQAAQRAVKVLLHGPYGTGKTEIALRFAQEFTGSDCNIELVNGKQLTVDYVREFRVRASQRSMFGTGCFCLVADECDKMSPDARDLLLSVLDQLGDHCAFIATTNQDLLAADSKLETARFQSRLHCLEISAPIASEIAALIVEVNPDFPANIADTIARASAGCVRSALIDAENFLDTKSAINAIAA